MRRSRGRGRLPDDGDWILTQRNVGGNHRQVLSDCLRNYQPVERILVMERKDSECEDMRKEYWQHLHVVCLLLILNQLLQGYRKCQLPDLQLDLHLPGANDTDGQRIHAVLASRTRGCRKLPASCGPPE